jgi:hypothetical protein
VGISPPRARPLRRTRARATTLDDLLARETFFKELPAIEQHATAMEREYARRFDEAPDARVTAYSKAHDELLKTPLLATSPSRSIIIGTSARRRLGPIAGLKLGPTRARWGIAPTNPRNRASGIPGDSSRRNRSCSIWRRNTVHHHQFAMPVRSYIGVRLIRIKKNAVTRFQSTSIVKSAMNLECSSQYV